MRLASNLLTFFKSKAIMLREWKLKLPKKEEKIQKVFKNQTNGQFKRKKIYKIKG